MVFAVIAFMYFTGEVLKPLALAVLLSFAPGTGVPRSRTPAAAAGGRGDVDCRVRAWGF